MRTAADLVSSAIYSRRLKWSGSPVAEEGKDPTGYVFNAAWGVGGAALHHYAVWPRLHPEDFEMKLKFQRGQDWPLRYADLAPHYDRVQSEVGVAGDAAQEHWRPSGAPYPMPPVKVFGQGRVIARGFERLKKHIAPLPMAVTTSNYHGRAECLWDGWCDSGCPIGALGNPWTVYLPRAIAAGAELVTDSPVVKVHTNKDGSRASGVEIVTSHGARRVVEADLVVLAAFAFETPRLLLASANPAHPTGLGNAADFVGRYIMTHNAGLVFGLFEEETQPTRGALGGQLLNQDSYPKNTHAARGAFGSYQWMIAQAVRPNDLLGMALSRSDVFGAPLQDFMQRAARGFAGMTAVVEDLPRAENRLTLQSATDSHGVPLARVVHECDPATRALWQSALAEGQEVFHAAGAREVWTGPPGKMHLMGGTIMGTHRENSVTNQYGQLHDIPNLVVAGPGLFPTSGGVNPTFTVHALAARSADRLLANWRSIAA
jgi:choline dehydrogenase-like flavoprotein